VNDLLSNIVMALGSSGTAVAVELYEPYGSPNYSWGTMPTDHNYTGQRLDSQSGLLYYGARWYDPLADQFTSADSVQGDPSGMDPYGYVGRNPETDVDPTGQRIADICDEDPEACDTNANSRENEGTIGPYHAPTNGLPPDEGSIPASAVVVPEVTVALGDTTFTLDEGTNMITEETIGPNGEPEFTTITPNDPNYLATMDEIEALQDGGFPDEGANTTAQGLSDESGSASPQTTNDNGNSSTNASENSSSSSSSTSSSSESNASSCGDGLSFAYNTPVATVKGEQAIGTLKVGEKVWAYNPQTKKMELEVIQKVWLNHDNDLVNVTLVATVKDAQGKTTQKKEVIHTNEKHPFLTKEKGFIPVSQLKPEMHVQEADGNYGVVAKLVLAPGAQWMYNLTVAQDHTYAVGLGQWIVHNINCINDASKEQKRFVQPTIDRVNAGIPDPHPNDRSIYGNRNGALPLQPYGYYREYVIRTPGVAGPGPQRLIIGAGGDIYYSPLHYSLVFYLIQAASP
jgi:RHS repeat-associated protein